MNLSIFIPLMFALQIFYWYIGKRASKNLETQEEYFLAGKNVKFFPLMMTFLATQVGGGYVCGAAEEAYRFGWTVLFYPLGGALGLILLGSGIGKKLAQFPVSTVAQVLEIVYGSKSLKHIASVLSIVSLFMILVAQIIASSKFLISLGFTSTPLFIIFWGIVILYTVQGGLKAVISTDIAQATFFVCIFLLSFAFTAPQFDFPQMQAVADSTSKFWGWLLMPLMFMVIEQDMGQRCFAGKCPKTVSKAAFWAGVSMMIICTVPVFFGVLARSLNLEIPQGASVLMIASGKTMGPWLTAGMGCAVLAAIISTATSLISAISSNLTMDFKIRFSKTTTGAIAIGAIFFAFFFNNILDLMIQSYDLSVSCLFVPIVMALFRKNGTYLSALLSILFGATGFCLFKMVELPIPKEIASVLLSFIGYALGEAWKQRTLFFSRS